MKISFTVPGKPQPAGSKRGFPMQGSDGRIRVVITDANKNAKPWQAAVRAEAALAYRGELLRGPVSLSLRFYMVRPKAHFGAKGMRDKAPRYPTTKPDALKLARAVEDSLTGIIYADDAQIVVERIEKHYGPQDGCVIEVESIENEALGAMLRDEKAS